MKKLVRAGLAVCVLCLAVSAALAQMTPQPFSSDMAIATKNGQKVNGKFYFAPPKQRMDMSNQGHDVSAITNASTQTTYILMTQQHMYMETHAGQASPMTQNLPKIEASLDASNPCAGRSDVTCKKVGTETVNGRSCDKWEFTDKKGSTTNAWIDQKLHFPIRVVNSDGSSVEFTNIKEGAPSASTFEIPAGYRKFDMPAVPGMPGRPPQ